MLKITNSSRVVKMQIFNEQDCKVCASYNSDGTITLKHSSVLYDGQAETIILGKAETLAIFRLFRDIDSFAGTAANERELC